MEDDKKQEGGRSLENPSGFANWFLSQLGSFPPTEPGRQGPIFRCFLEQTVNSFGSLEFSQAGTLMEARVIPGI